MLTRALIAGALACALAAAPAAANTVERNGGVITVNTPTASAVVIDTQPPNIVFSNGLGNEMTSTTCVVTDAVRCPISGTTRIDVIAGPGENTLFLFTLGIPLTWQGLGGDDDAKLVGGATGRLELRGGDGDDELGSGAGSDLLDGGAGSDRLGFNGNDEVIGGPDVDTLDNASGVSGAFHISLDGVANDGIGGPGTGNLHGDIEELRLDDDNDVVTGGPGPETIRAGGGNDTINGGGGHDFIDGDTGNDTITATDGLGERVDCGKGTDTATLDDVDASLDCENVSVTDQVRPDVDADGARKPGDCNDNNAGIRPGAVDVPENGVDEDCDGADAVVLDRDGDGVPRPQDCDDTRTDVRPGAREVLGNKVDEDCNGEADPFRVLPVRLSHRTLAFATFTTVERLRLSRVRRGQTVRLQCKGGGCKFKSRKVRVRKRGKLNLTKRLQGARLRGGAKLTLRVTARNGVAKQFAFTFRRGAAPIFLIRCREPGTGLRRCQS